mgnify:CR=1 FL=1
MDLIEGILKKQTVLNSKGGEYYNSTYNDNLDLFSGVNRYTDTCLLYTSPSPRDTR